MMTGDLVKVALYGGPSHGDVLTVEEGVVMHGLIVPVPVEPWPEFSATEPTTAPIRMALAVYRVSHRLCDHLSSIMFDTPEYVMTCNT